MDYLKEGIGLRAMAQRDPLVEYQREGFDMFAAMLDSLKEESVGFLYNLQVQAAEPPPPAAAPAPQVPLRLRRRPSSWSRPSRRPIRGCRAAGVPRWRGPRAGTPAPIPNRRRPTCCPRRSAEPARPTSATAVRPRTAARCAPGPRPVRRARVGAGTAASATAPRSVVGPPATGPARAARAASTSSATARRPPPGPELTRPA